MGSFTDWSQLLCRGRLCAPYHHVQRGCEDPPSPLRKTQPEREAYNSFPYNTEVKLYLHFSICLYGLVLWYKGNFTFTLAEISSRCYVCHKTLRKAGAGNENRDGRSSLHLNYSVPCGMRFMKLRRPHDAVCCILVL